MKFAIKCFVETRNSRVSSTGCFLVSTFINTGDHLPEDFKLRLDILKKLSIG